MDGSAPDAPEVSADIDSPEKPESVSGLDRLLSKL